MSRSIACAMGLAFGIACVSSTVEGADDAKEIDKLTKQLSHKSAERRAGAAGVLGYKGPAAGAAAPALIGALSDPDATVRRAAAQALRKVVPGGAQAELLALAKSEPEQRVYEEAVAGLKDERLAELLKAPGSAAREIALLANIDDKALVARTLKEKTTVSAAWHPVVEEIKEPALLLELVQSENPALRRLAVRRLRDEQEKVVQIARTHPKADTRVDAIVLIQDREARSEVAKKETDPAARKWIEMIEGSTPSQDIVVESVRKCERMSIGDAATCTVVFRNAGKVAYQHLFFSLRMSSGSAMWTDLQEPLEPGQSREASLSFYGLPKSQVSIEATATMGNAVRPASP